MESIRSAMRSALLLVLCAAVLATAAAKEWHEGVLFSDKAKTATISTNTKNKLTGDYQSPELRQVCLREKKQINCNYYGCPDALDCSDGVSCARCLPETSYQTELACCKDKKYGSYSSEADGATGDLNGVAPSIKVGTCDWTVNTYSCDGSIYGANCVDGFVLENNADKAGTVWATCYFNSESESCGHPFCDKTVMSFQGGWYIMQAYTVGDPYTQAPEVDTSCGISIRSQLFKRTIQHSNVAQKFLKKDPTALDRLLSEKASRGAGDDAKYYLGFARVVSGPVTVTSLYRTMDYNRGMLEWVSEFLGPVAVSSPPAGVMPVVPYTMTLTLASSGGSYDSYQP